MKMPDGQIGFVGKDVAEVLGYKDASKALCDRVDTEDKTTLLIQQSGSNYKSKTTFINESGLYSLILSSKLPKAREFKHWVTSEVLPQIRKTGGYIPVSSEDDEKTILARALSIMQRTMEQKDRLLEEQRPKVAFADALTASDDSILMRELAKLLTQNGYPTGERRLYRWMRDNGYIFKHSTAPMQQWVEKGLFETSITLVHTHHGDMEVITTRVTGKGQRHFIQLLC